MALTGLNWKRFSAIINGLVLRGAIEKIEKNYYITKGI
jgi:predicted transcriptional regulator